MSFPFYLSSLLPPLSLSLPSDTTTPRTAHHSTPHITQVMWIRRTTDKVSLLTVGNNTYSGDPRIRVKFQYPNNWRLHINPIKYDDGGLYMCQVSTHPPRVFATNLTILGKYPFLLPSLSHSFFLRSLLRILMPPMLITKASYNISSHTTHN